MRHVKGHLARTCNNSGYDKTLTFRRPPPSDERPRRSLLDDKENNAFPPPPLHQPFNLPQRPEQPFSIGSDDLNPNFNPFPGSNPFSGTGPRGMFADPNQLFQQGGARPRVPWPGGTAPQGPLGPFARPAGSRFDEIGPVEPNNDMEPRLQPGQHDFQPPSFRGSGGGNPFGGGNFDNM